MQFHTASPEAPPGYLSDEGFHRSYQAEVLPRATRRSLRLVGIQPSGPKSPLAIVEADRFLREAECSEKEKRSEVIIEKVSRALQIIGVPRTRAQGFLRANCLIFLGQQLARLNDEFALAIDCYREAASISRMLLKRSEHRTANSASDVEYRRQLVETYTSWAQSAERLGRLKQSNFCYGRAISNCRLLQPYEVAREMDLLTSRAELMSKMRKPQAAHHYIRAAIELATFPPVLQRVGGNNDDLRALRGELYLREAGYLYELRRTKKAVEACKHAQREFDKLEYTDARTRAQLFHTETRIALDNGNPREAFTLLRKYIEWAFIAGTVDQGALVASVAEAVLISTLIDLAHDREANQAALKFLRWLGKNSSDVNREGYRDFVLALGDKFTSEEKHKLAVTTRFAIRDMAELNNNDRARLDLKIACNFIAMDKLLLAQRCLKRAKQGFAPSNGQENIEFRLEYSKARLSLETERRPRKYSRIAALSKDVIALTKVQNKSKIKISKEIFSLYEDQFHLFVNGRRFKAAERVLKCMQSLGPQQEVQTRTAREVRASIRMLEGDFCLAKSKKAEAVKCYELAIQEYEELLKGKATRSPASRAAMQALLDTAKLYAETGQYGSDVIAQRKAAKYFLKYLRISRLRKYALTEQLSETATDLITMLDLLGYEAFAERLRGYRDKLDHKRMR